MSNDIKGLVRDLAGVDRRIDNMRYLVVFQERKRERILEGIRRKLGRAEVRTRFIEYDSRRDPKTDRWCVMCQKDVGAKTVAGRIRLVLVDGGRPDAIHREDVGLLDIGVLRLPAGAEDQGYAVIGADCARILGADWWMPEAPKGKDD